MHKNSRPPTPAVCPVCGEDVPPRARACPECGADHESGWRACAETHDGVDLPDDEFDYDAFVQEEFGSPPKPSSMKWIWWITALVLIVLTALGWFSLVH